MSERAVFYRLSHKFVNNDASIPENAEQVIYYSLAIGHHVGVMDCFKSILEIPMNELQVWLSRFPESPGRQKLAGIIKWGEIEINSSHAAAILSTLNTGLPNNTKAEADWTHILLHCLEEMVGEPALYLMVRKRA
jgi:hydrogenase-4 component J